MSIPACTLHSEVAQSSVELMSAALQDCDIQTATDVMKTSLRQRQLKSEHEVPTYVALTKQTLPQLGRVKTATADLRYSSAVMLKYMIDIIPR